MIWNSFLVFLSLTSVLNAETLETDENSDRGDNSSDFEYVGPSTTMVSPLGDIRLNEEQERICINFNEYTASKWPEGIVPYRIQSQFTTDEKRTIEDSLKELSQKISSILIRPWKKGDDHYVHIYKKDGCWSYMGRQGGGQELSLGKGCVYKNTIQHEFMHVLGFGHTQCRQDRDKYVKILWGNISEDWHSQYEKMNSDDFNDVGNYEPYSIMHYPYWSPSDPSKDAIEVKDKSIDKRRLGQGENGGVTQGDINKVNAVYSK